MRIPLPFMLLTALVAGCATVPQPQVEGGGAPRSEGADPQADLMFELLAGEMAGQLGAMEDSVEHYLRAAQGSSDPRVAERATRIALYAKDDSRALAAAERWVALSPESVDAHQVVGVLYVRNGDVERALGHFEEVLEATRLAHGDGFLLIGSLLSRDADPQRAAEAMSLLVERYPDQASAQFAYANLASRAGDYEAAARAANRAVALDPSLTDARILWARAMQAQGETEQALAEMKALVEQMPDNHDLRLAYAQMLVQAKRYDEALQEFGRVASERPNDADLLYTLGLLSIEAERYDHAEDYLQRVLRTGRHISEANYYLGRIAEERKEYKVAISWYLKVVEGDYSFDAQSRIAGMLAKLGRLDRAREHLENLRAQTQDDQVLVNLYLVEGQLLTDAKEYDEGMAHFNRALTLYPGNEDLLYARALMAEKLGRIDLLEADLRAILAQDPENATAMNALGYTLADRTDRYDEALDYISRALEMRPDDPAVIDSMGWVQYRLGNYAEAERHLRKAFTLLQDAEVAAHLVEVLWAQGEQAEARAILNEALDQDPENERLLELEGRLGL